MPIATTTARLRAAGLRVTRARAAILEALDDHPHVAADAVATAARSKVGTLSTQAVYDALHALTAAGVVRRIEPAGSPARYETRTGDNHHHLVCRRCQTVEDVDCLPATAPCLDIPSATAFVVDEAEVTFWGICSACQTATKERS